MKNMVKYAVAVLMLGLAGNTFAVSNTSHGVSLTDDMLLSESATNLRVRAPVADQSVYPTYNSRRGTIVRWYDASRDGTSGTISLEPKTPERANGMTNVPANFVVVGGFVDVIVPVTPASAGTNSLGFNTTQDVKTNAVNFGSVGRVALQEVWTAGSSIKLTNNLPLNFTVETGTITQGVFMVILDGYQGQ